MTPLIKRTCALLVLAACDVPEIFEREAALEQCAVSEEFGGCPADPMSVGSTGGDESGADEATADPNTTLAPGSAGDLADVGGPGTTVDDGTTGAETSTSSATDGSPPDGSSEPGASESDSDTPPMPEVIDDPPVLPLGCWGETIPWYQSYQVSAPVDTCYHATPEGTASWVGTAGQTALFYNNSAARIGYRNFSVIDCGPDGDGTVVTVQYSQFYSTNDAQCIVPGSGLGDDIAFVDRGGSSAITSLTPLIGD